jgi:uncharacterized membrane protein
LIESAFFWTCATWFVFWLVGLHVLLEEK